MNRIIEEAKSLYSLQDFELKEVDGHEGGRNQIFICRQDGLPKFVLRVSATGDRTENDYLAETEFVHFLAMEGASVADVIPSVNGNLVEVAGDAEIAGDAGAAVDFGKTDESCATEDAENTADTEVVADDVDLPQFFLSLFEYANGMLLCDNGYRYREGAPLEEYFFNTGKTLGKIHALSKRFVPSSTECRRPSYFDKYNMEYINRLIPDTPSTYADLKNAISARLEKFRSLPTDKQSFGLVHFDFSDGNYHIDMTNGDITVFDFDNCMYCWYMFDLANLWIHGEGWCRGIPEPEKREAFMRHYFDTILEGYKTETSISDTLINQLPLFIDMVLIENIVDEFECAVREGETIDPEDIRRIWNPC